MAIIILPTIPGVYLSADSNNNQIKFPIDLYPARQIKIKVISGSYKFSLSRPCSPESPNYVAGTDLILTITDVSGYLNLQSLAPGAEVHFEI